MRQHIDYVVQQNRCNENVGQLFLQIAKYYVLQLNDC